MTFEQYVNYRFIETLIGWSFWAVIFLVIGVWKLVLFIQKIRRDQREFARVSKELMKEVEEDEHG